MHAVYLATRASLALPLYMLMALAAFGTAAAQDSKDFAVMLSATTIKSPQPTITLHWNRDSYAKAYEVYRKLKTDPAWPQNPLATLDSSATSFMDDDVELGRGYEYRVFKRAVHMLTDTTGLTYYGAGYIYAGIELLPPLARGKVLVLVDSTMAAPLSNELGLLERDMQKEGWTVVRRLTPRAEAFDGAAVKRVKAMVVEEYNRAPKTLTTVLIVGRVPVPYSGQMNPDGHDDHLGAWPADAYYGDIDGNWTDASIRDTSASRPENRNVPGDGKFDQVQIPSNVELGVGRVDFYNMPAFHETETELLRKYLNKDHFYRTGQLAVRAGGIVDDNFPASSYQEAFASAGWRNITVFGGDTAVRADDWFTSLGGAQTYQWAYGCGGGWYAGAGGIGSTDDFAAKPVNAVFTMLFGSYFGDWDAQNNFLRASIAGGPAALTCAWVARPQWYFHHMAMGETIGYSTTVSQNNSTAYIPNVYFTQQYPNGVLITYGNRFAHVALMGDPTLRVQMSAIAEPDAFQIELSSGGIPKLSWLASPDPVDGYLLYRRMDSGAFELLTDEPTRALIYYDPDASADTANGHRPIGDTATYLLRPVVLRHNASGSYYDGPAPISNGARIASVPSRLDRMADAVASPNPASDEVAITATLRAPSVVGVEMFDMAGRHVRALAPRPWDAGLNRVRWDLADDHGARVPAGVYVARITGAGVSGVVKIVVAGQ